MTHKRKKNSERVYSKLDDNSPILEAYRMLRTNIEFSSSVNEIKKILITSSVSGEGKSTISVNLAKIFPMNGKKALVVALDLRRPTIHKIMGEHNTGGITSCLLGKHTPSEVIRKAETENLYFINCGDIPMNPAELLASEKIKSIIGELEDEFDLIILDSPPCSTLADAAIAARLADAVLLIVSVGNVRYFEVEQAKNNLEKTGASILGIVMNNITSHSRGYKYYNYYYY